MYHWYPWQPCQYNKMKAKSDSLKNHVFSTKTPISPGASLQTLRNLCVQRILWLILVGIYLFHGQTFQISGITPAAAIFQNGCQISYFAHNFRSNWHRIMIFGSKYMFMDMRNPFKMVLSTSTAPEVAIFQNGCQKPFLAIILLIIVTLS